MSDGFLGYNASFMLDFVVTALVLIVPALAYSVYAVKFQCRYRLHRGLQIWLAIILFVAVSLFEVDIRLHGGWEEIVRRAHGGEIAPDKLGPIQTCLYIHLVFAVTTPFLWGTTLWLALRRMPSPPAPSAHSRLHKRLGWLSTADLVLTSLTGVAFYYLAFVR